MITSRGWWFLVLIFSMLMLGAFDERGWTLTLLALTLVLWFMAEWFLFTLRIRLAVPALHCRREVSDERGPVDTLWAGRAFQVAALVACALLSGVERPSRFGRPIGFEWPPGARIL